MKILLPPSEGKNFPKKLRNLKLENLAFANDLRDLREIILANHPEIDTSRCDQAMNIYSGVLFQALDYQSLSKLSKSRADKSILIFSAAYGVVLPTAKISSYKFKPSPAKWRKVLTQTIGQLDDELIVDLRSSTYKAMWTSNPEFTVGIRVFALVNGKKKVITHMSKKTRGEVARFLVSKPEVKTPIELYKIMKTRFTCALVSASTTECWYLDVIAK